MVLHAVLRFNLWPPRSEWRKHGTPWHVCVCELMGNHIVTNRFTEARNNKMKKRRTFIGTVRHVSGGAWLLTAPKTLKFSGWVGGLVGGWVSVRGLGIWSAYGVCPHIFNEVFKLKN